MRQAQKGKLMMVQGVMEMEMEDGEKVVLGMVALAIEVLLLPASEKRMTC